MVLWFYVDEFEWVVILVIDLQLLGWGLIAAVLLGCLRCWAGFGNMVLFAVYWWVSCDMVICVGRLVLWGVAVVAYLTCIDVLGFKLLLPCLWGLFICVLYCVNSVVI